MYFFFFQIRYFLRDNKRGPREAWDSAEKPESKVGWKRGPWAILLVLYHTPTFFPHPETPQNSSQDKSRTSLVVQWERICLPMQGTGVWSLVWEDPTCRGTLNSCAPTEPAHLELGSRNCWSPHMPGACAPREKPLQWGAPCSPQLEKSLNAVVKTQCSPK